MTDTKASMAAADRNLRQVLGRFSGFTQIALWLALLSAVIPAIARQWVWGWIDTAAAPSEYLLSTPGIIYLTFCGIALIAFPVLARQRRVIMALLALLMISLQWATGALGWERIITYLIVLAISTLVVEAVRQNRGLYRQLKRDEVSTLRIFWRSVYLWSPLLLIILIGFYGNQLLFEASQRVIYGATPIDQYCATEQQGHRYVIPCTGLLENLEAESIRQLPIEETLQHHVQTRFSTASRQLLQSAETAAVADFADFDYLQDVVDALNPRTILGLNAGLDRLSVLQRTDPTLLMLRFQRDQLRRSLEKAEADYDSVASAPGFLQQMLAGALTTKRKEVNAAEATLNAAEALRISQLTTQLDSEPAQPLQPAEQALQKLLYRDLAFSATDVKELYSELSGRPATQQPAFAQVSYLRLLDQLEPDTQRQLERWLQRPGARAFAYRALIMAPRCTTAQIDKTVESADGEPTWKNTEAFPCFKVAPGTTLQLQPLGLVESMNRSIDRWQLERERVLVEQLRQLTANSYRSAAEVQNTSQEIVNAIPDEIDLGRKSCHVVLRPGNCITNYVKGQAEASYREKRSDFEQGVRNETNAQARGAAQSVEEQLLQIRADAYGGLAASADFMRSAVTSLQQLGKALAALLNGFLAIAIIKSFLYVLATRIFDAKSEFHMNLATTDAVQGHYESAPSIQIERDFIRPLITKDVLDNQAVSTAIAPWPLSAPFARILTGSYFAFNKGSHFEMSDENISLTRASGHDVVHWHMEEGEEVVFHYRNFFGASDNIELKTTISLRLSTMLLGRFVFHSALCKAGPGRLLLTAAGTVREQGKTDSTSLVRLLAWNKHTRFRVASQGTIRSVLLDGYAIVRLREEGAKNGLIVVEAIRESRSKIMGSLRFVRNLLLPF